MKFSFFQYISVLTTLLLICFSSQIFATGIEVDSTLSTNKTLVTPLPIKSIQLVKSNKEPQLKVNPSDESAVNFSIANPSRQQITDWLAGDYSDLNQTFSDLGPETKSAMLDSLGAKIAKARAAINKVKEVGNFVSRLTGESLQSMPIGLTDTLKDNTVITVGISNIYLYPEYASLEIYVEIISPNFQLPLFLGAPDVKFSRLGGISGVVSLGLLGDFVLPVFEDKASILLRSAMVDPENNTFKTGQGTYAEFSCDGIESISIDANLAISREVLLPANVNIQNPDTTKTVNADFFITTSNGISDILTEVNFDQPFYHVKNDKLIWTIQSAIFDFSTLDHRQGLNFPVNNYDPTVPLASIENWQGVYIKEITVEWRDSMAQVPGQTPKSFSISGTKIIIDEAGFTGRITAKNIIPLSDNRQINKWAFSIDYLEVSIVTNTFESLDFSGHLGMPMTYPDNEPPKDTTKLINYAGSFDFAAKKYWISGNLPNDKVLPLKMFKGQIVIENTSVFTIGYAEEKIYLKANLNVDYETAGSEDNEDDKKLNVPLVEVTGLEVSSLSPFLIKTGNWILRDTISVASFGGFGLNINSLIVRKNVQTMDTELIVGADINLAAGDKVHISGATVVRVIANIEDTPSSQKWKFKDVKLDMIAVEAELEAFSISGQVVFFDNLDNGSSSGQLGYGKGFQGNVSLQIKGLNKKDDGGGSGFMAMALFGSATDSENEKFRYFMVDVLAYFSNGLPIGPIGLYGVGGGVYYRMEQEDLGSNFTNIPAFDPPPSEQVDDYTTYISGFLGESLSGTKYRPSERVLLGINLNVILGSLPKPQAFNTNIGLNMEFNTNGGLNFIKLKGIMNAMTDISPEGPACSGVSLAVEMEFVFRTRADRTRTGFYASAHAFLKVGPLSGSNSDNIPGDFANYIARCSDYDLGYAGGLEMQFSKDYWFLNVGEPDSRLGLKLNLWKLGEIRLETYFDIGKNIPAFPGLPAEVRSLTRMSNLLQNETTRAGGTGFAFGVSFDASMDTPRFLGFSAHLKLGAGFDIMLNKFRDVNCLNSGSPKPIGVKNWYAAGQAWLYIDGSLKFMGNEVMGLGLAAAIQIKGPNPTFGRGALAGRVRVGPFKKKFNVHFKFGKECQFQGSQELEQEIDLILFMTPSNDDQSIEVTTQIDVVFAQELDKTFIVTNANTGYGERYKIEMESFEITDPDGNQIDAHQEQISDQFYRYLPKDQLKSNTEYTLTLKAILRDSVNNLVEREERIHIFKTGNLPTEIFNSNVDYAIPGDGQFNYYKFDQSSQYIQLLQGQDELLTDLPEGQSLKVKISTTHPASISYKNCSYSTEMNRINYTLPASLVNGKVYKLEIISLPNEELSNYANATDFDLDEFNLPSPFENEKVFHTLAFRVSNYNTFEEKNNAIQFSSMLDVANPVPNKPPSHFIQVNNLSEPFGIEDVEGLYENNPSTIFEADLNQTSWITNYYRNYNAGGGSSINIYGPSYSGRITDFLDADRSRYFGPAEPARGIFIVQDSIFQAKESNLFSYNDGFDYAGINTKLDYALGKIMFDELDYVYNIVLEELEGLIQVDGFYADDDEEESYPFTCYDNIAILRQCCNQYDDLYTWELRRYVDYRLSTGSALLNKFFYAPESRAQFCKLEFNLVSKRNLFTNLKSGNYPVFVKYYKPTSNSPFQTFNQTFIKN